MKDLVAERTGTQPGQYGGMFALNPRVDDIPDALQPARGVRLLVLGTIKQGRRLFCAEAHCCATWCAFLLVGRDEVVILDLEAGLEHLGRSTAAAVDAFIVVVEPGRRSVQTAQAVQRLARDIGIERVLAVGNRIRSPQDEAFIAAGLPGVEVLGFLPYSPEAIEADLQGRAVFAAAPALVERAREIKGRLDAKTAGNS